MQVDTYYFWSATLRISAPKALVVGEQGSLAFSLQDEYGRPVGDGSGLRTISVDATVDGKQIQVTQGADGGWQADVSLPNSGSATSHGRRSASVKGSPRRSFSTLPGGW